MFFIVLGSSFLAEMLHSILVTETCLTTFDFYSGVLKLRKMFVSSNGKCLFCLKCCTAVICLLFYKEAVDSTLCHFFFYIIVTSLYSLCYVSQAFGRSIQVSAIAREKTSEMSRLGAGKCPHFRNSGSLFQSFLYAFRRGAGSCPH